MRIVDVDEVGPPRRAGDVAAVVLAAGTSSRFDDRNKLLTEVHGEPLVVRSIRALMAADVHFAPFVVVVGHEADQVREVLGGLDVDVVENPDYESGQATSVRAGVDAVADADAVVFALGDMPHVSPGTVEALVAAYRAGVGDALAAACDGQRGNPVLFGRRHFDALSDVSGDTGGRSILLESDDAALVETGDPGVLADVDEPEDLDRDSAEEGPGAEEGPDVEEGPGAEEGPDVEEGPGVEEGGR